MSSKPSATEEESTRSSESDEETPEPRDDVAESEVGDAQAESTADDESEEAESDVPDEPEHPEEGDGDELTEPEVPDNRYQLWFLAAAFVTVACLLLLILRTNAWDPSVCETSEDCRGLRQCIEGHCSSPEVWEIEHGAPPPLAPEAAQGEGTE